MVALALYRTTIAAGNEEQCALFEDAAEAWFTELANGGTAKLLAANPERFKLNPGDATSEIIAARTALNMMAVQREDRVPQWLKDARTVNLQLLNLCGRLVGNHVDFMSTGQASGMWSGTASQKLPNPLDISPTWGTRYLTNRRGVNLPGDSPLEAKFANGRTRRVAATTPVRALRAWLEASQIAEGPIFRAVGRSGPVGDSALDDRAVARLVKRAVARAGLDPAKVAGHSLRSGFITTAAKRGKSTHAIMRQSGHRSEAVMRGYIQLATLFDDNAAAGLL